MVVPEKVLSRVAFLVASGDAEGLRTYLGYVFPPARELKTLREAMAASFTPAFVRTAIELAPWIEGDYLQQEWTAIADLPSVRDQVATALDHYGADGLKGSELRRIIPNAGLVLEEMLEAGEITRERQATAGRPAEVFRLAEHSAGVVPIDHDRDPFAFRPAIPA